MANIVLRKKLHSFVDDMDDRYLKTIYSYLKDFTAKDYEIDADEKELLDSRRTAIMSGKVKGMSLENVNRKLASKPKK